MVMMLVWFWRRQYFYGHGLTKMLAKSIKNAKEENKATVFGYYVTDPERYGVAEFDDEQNVISLEEKPKTQNQIMLLLAYIFILTML